jgi:hypothetical protein
VWAAWVSGWLARGAVPRPGWAYLAPGWTSHSGVGHGRVVGPNLPGPSAPAPGRASVRGSGRAPAAGSGVAGGGELGGDGNSSPAIIGQTRSRSLYVAFGAMIAASASATTWRSWRICWVSRSRRRHRTRHNHWTRSRQECRKTQGRVRVSSTLRRTRRTPARKTSLAYTASPTSRMIGPPA